ncbi:hypothetical protein M3J09_008391 [Ascochyta lentis]
MLPALLVFSLFWLSKGRLLIQNSEGEKLDGCESEFATNQHVDILVQALRNPDHPVHQLIEMEIAKANHTNEQSAVMDLVNDEIATINEFYKAKAVDFARTAMAKATAYYIGKLADAERNNATTERTVTSIENRLHAIQQQVQGEIPKALCRKIAGIISSTAKTTIEKADQDRFRKLALISSDSDHDLLQDLNNRVVNYDASFQSLVGLPAKISEWKAGIKKQLEDVKSAVSEQDEIIAKFINTYKTPTVLDTDAEALLALQKSIHNHDTQLQSFIKTSADLDELKVEVRTFAESFRRLSATASTVSAMERSLRDHDIQITKLGDATTSMAALMEQREQLEKKTEKVKKDISGEASKAEVAQALQGSIEKIETSLAELQSIPSQVEVLGDRTKALGDELFDQKELFKQLKNIPSDMDVLTKQSDAYEDTLTRLHIVVNELANDIDSIKSDIHATATVLPASGASTKDLQHHSSTTETSVPQGSDASQASTSADVAATATLETLQAPSSTPENEVAPGPNAPASLFDWSLIPLPASTPSASNTNGFLSTQIPDSYTFGNDARGSMPHSFRMSPPVATSDALSTPSSTQSSPPHEDANTSRPASHDSIPAADSSHDETMDDWPGYDETGIPEPGEELDNFLADLGEERLDDDVEMGVEEDAEGDSDDENAP